MCILLLASIGIDCSDASDSRCEHSNADQQKFFKFSGTIVKQARGIDSQLAHQLTIRKYVYAPSDPSMIFVFQFSRPQRKSNTVIMEHDFSSTSCALQISKPKIAKV